MPIEEVIHVIPQEYDWWEDEFRIQGMAGVSWG